MSKFQVTIKATLTKAYVIEAETEEAAIEEAHEGFDLHYEDGVNEDYNEELVSVIKLTEEE